MRLQVHEAVDEAFEHAFESLEPYLNKTGELGGVTPYSEVGSCVLGERLHVRCMLRHPLARMAGMTFGVLACCRCPSQRARRSRRRHTTWPLS
jgi:hypothetical protein